MCALALCTAMLGVAVASPSPTGARHGKAPGTPRCGFVGRAPWKATGHELRSSALCLVNRVRRRRGVHPLAFDRALRRAATAHSREMVKSGSLSHYGADGGGLIARAARFGYLDGASSYRLAENIAAGRGRRGTPRAIVRQWLRSEVHRDNILDPALRDFGLGVARGHPFGGGGNAATYTLLLGAREG